MKDHIIRLLAVVVSALLTGISLTSSAWSVLGWLAFAPLLAAVYHVRTKWELFFTIFFWNAGIGVFTAFWVPETLRDFTSASIPVSILLFLLLILVQSVPYWVWAYTQSALQWKDKARFSMKSALLLAVLLFWWPSFITWRPDSFIAYSPFMGQLLGVGGPLLSSFLFSLFSWQLYFVVVSADWRIRKQALIVSLSVISLFVGCGVWVFWEMSPLDESEQLRVGLAQGMNTNDDNATLLKSLTFDLVEQDPAIDLIVWPEIPFSFAIENNKKHRKFVSDITTITGKPMLVYSSNYRVDLDTRATEILSNAYLIHASGEASAGYGKRKLIPLVETSIRQGIFGGENGESESSYRVNESHNNLVLSQAVSIVPQICYEAMYSQNLYDGIQQGGNVIVVLSNTIWATSDWVWQLQMLLMRQRSIEYGVPLIFSNNAGTSGFINARGEIQEQAVTQAGEVDSVVGVIDIPPQRSLYFHLYRYISIGFLVVLVIFLIRDFWDRRKSYSVRHSGDTGTENFVRR